MTAFLSEDYRIVNIKRRDKREKIWGETPFLVFILKKNRRVILFCKNSKRFFVADKATFELTGKKYLIKNRPPHFRQLGNHFRFLYLAITSKCNMACAYCFGSEAERVGKTADMKTIKAAVDYIAKQKEPVDRVVFTSAGEHTLEPELLEKTIEYINRKLDFSEMRISLNGTMSPKIYLRLSDYFDGFQISFDGPPEIQDLQRPMKGGGKSSKRVEAVLRELKRNNKNFHIRTTLTPNHLGKEERTFKYFYDLEIPRVVFSTVGDLGSGCVYYEKKGKKRLSGLQLKIKELCDEFGLRSMVAVELLLNNKDTVFCPIGRSFNLGVDGTVATCVMYSDEKDLEVHPGMDKLLIGKFNREKGSFEMNEKKIKELRNVYKKAFCYDCDFKLCWGGCSARNVQTGKIEEPQKKLCQDRKRETRDFLNYLAQRNVIRIKPCLLGKKGKLYYSMQFSEFPLAKCGPENIPNKSAFIVFDPAKDNLRKMEKKMTLATRRNKNIVLFILSPKYSNRLDREKSINFQNFLYSLKKNKVLFKISSPVKITAENQEKERLFYKELQVPQSCLECLEMFKLKSGRVVFCGGVKGPKVESFFNKGEIFSAFQKNNINYNK